MWIYLRRTSFALPTGNQVLSFFQMIGEIENSKSIISIGLRSWHGLGLYDGLIEVAVSRLLEGKISSHGKTHGPDSRPFSVFERTHNGTQLLLDLYDITC